MIIVVYRIEDGEIVSVAHGVEPRVNPGCKTLAVSSSLIDSKLHRVDLATLNIVDKTDVDEMIAAFPERPDAAASLRNRGN